MEDLRVIKTRNALFNAFQELMEKKDFDSITVNELCEKAVVRRATFYKHFMDKYDFFGYYCRRVQEEFIERYRNSDYDSGSYFGSLTGALLDFYTEKEALVRHVVQSGAYPGLLDIVGDTIYRDVLEMVRSGSVESSDLQPEDRATFFAGGMIRLLSSRVGKPVSGDEKKRLSRSAESFAAMLGLTAKEPFSS